MPSAAPLERKQLTLDGLTFTNLDTGSFGGYASVFGGVDSYGDTIVPGAYADTIPKFLSDGFIGWAHDDLTPVAYPTAVREDAHGLWVEAQFHSTPQAQEARQVTLERIAAGKRMGLSIGYYPVKAESGPDGTRRLLAIDLIETSLVMVPADDAARVAHVKAASDALPPETDADSPVATTCGYGSVWAEHTQTVQDALTVALQETEAFYVRALAQDQFERKEGRRISTETRAQLQQVVDARGSLNAAFDVIEQLLADTAPPPKGWDYRLNLRELESRLRLRGIVEGVPT